MTTVDSARWTGTLVTVRRLTWCLFLYAGWFAMAAAAALGRAAYIRGEPYIPSVGDEFTGSIVIWPGGLAPIGALLSLTAVVGPMAAVVLVIVGVNWLRDPLVRASRPTRNRLLAAVLLVTVTLVLTFGPGNTVYDWIVD